MLHAHESENPSASTDVLPGYHHHSLLLAWSVPRSVAFHSSAVAPLFLSLEPRALLSFVGPVGSCRAAQTCHSSRGTSHPTSPIGFLGCTRVHVSTTAIFLHFRAIFCCKAIRLGRLCNTRKPGRVSSSIFVSSLSFVGDGLVPATSCVAVAWLVPTSKLQKAQCN